MPIGHIMKKVNIVLLFSILLGGCANIPMPYEVNQRTEVDPVQVKHDAMIGANEDTLVETYGAPDDVKQVGSFRVLSYITDRGVTASGAYYQGYSSARSKAHAQVSRFYFKNGVCTTWDYEYR